MNFIVRKTNEMSRVEKEKICDLFFEVFAIQKTLKDFINQFENTDLGCSYFCLAYDKDKIVGSYAAIPEFYSYFGKNVIFAQSVDTMIKPDYQGNPFTLKKMTNLLYTELTKQNVSFVYGFPNDNIYLIRERVLKWKNIYNLDIYLIPLNLSFISKNLKIFDYILKKIVLLINIFAANSKKLEIPIHRNIIKKNTVFKSKKNKFKAISTSGVQFNYSVKKVKNARVAILSNIRPLTKINFEKVVKEMTKFDEVDMISYIGHLNFKPINLFKLYKKNQPKNIRLSGKILREEVVDDRIFDINNWQINPLDFDWSS
tara:strand:- start:494 stop:1435 length:942 start_codon:yes stop_codon:yes gene_type:complete